jgi:hypothetical protein
MTIYTFRNMLFQCINQRWAHKLYLLHYKSQIRKLLGTFCNRKSTNFLGVPIRKSQIHKFVMINPQITNAQISFGSQSAKLAN